MACEREILEELGLTIHVGRLLCVDYSINFEGFENLQFIFDGGILSQIQIDKIKLADNEIKSFEFISIESESDQAFILQRDRLGPRLLKAIEAKQQNTTFYLEKGDER